MIHYDSFEQKSFEIGILKSIKTELSGEMLLQWQIPSEGNNYATEEEYIKIDRQERF